LASADFATSNEFQRADCEPSATKGNGTVDLGDFIQAGRYAAVLDPWTSVGGPGLPIPAPAIAESIFGTPMAVNSIPRVVRVVNVDASPGSQVTVSIEINAENSDKGISFTMDYDPSKLSNPVVNGGSGASGAVVIPNTTIPGKVIVQLAYITGGFASGVSQALTVKFDVATTAPSGATPLTFNDTPVQRQVRDTANALVASTFTDGFVNILAPTASGVPVVGTVMSATGRPIANTRVTLTNSEGFMWFAISNPFGHFRFDDIPSGTTYVLNGSAKRFAFAPQTLSVTDQVTNVNLIAEP